MKIDLDKLPRTIRFVRSDSSFPYIPNGYPILVLLDQSKLPYEVEYLHITDWREVIDCIKTLKVRGAPAIGIAGAAAVALRAAEFNYAQGDEDRKSAIDFERVFIIDEESFDSDLCKTAIEYTGQMVKRARPTAVNLSWAVDAIVQAANEAIEGGSDPKAIADRLYEFVCAMIDEDESINRAIGANGSKLLPSECTLLTHCNAGSLATSFYGTALGVAYAAAEEGKLKRVFADETRPVGQGSRLTAWELSQVGIPVTLICDDMAATVMSQGKIGAVVVGADRIAANGDVANKVGTLGVAILAKHFGIPFYVAAPTSTIDVSTAKGDRILIEERASEEVLEHPIEGVDVYNPAFDITPSELIASIITEVGVFEPSEIAAALKHDAHALDCQDGASRFS